MNGPIAAFDIETVPDTELGRRIFGYEGDFATIAADMQQRRLDDTGGRTDFLKPPYHRVVAIAVAWLDPFKGRFKLASLGSIEQSRDEGALLEAFFKVLEQRPRLVSWNGSGFDLPVLRYRAMLHGIDAGTYYDASDRYDTYTNRYHERHTDLMDVLSGYGASDRIGLDEMSRIVGLPGKTVTEGHRVFGHIADGEWELVRTYCELDALNTLLLYLAWELSRGYLDTEGFAAIMELIRGKLAEHPAEAVRRYALEIADWRPGRTRRWLQVELDGIAPDELP